MTEKFNPYDLDAIGRMNEQQNGRERLRRSAARTEVERRIRSIEMRFGRVNPYDLDQIAYIFEPLDELARRHAP